MSHRTTVACVVLAAAALVPASCFAQKTQLPSDPDGFVMLPGVVPPFAPVDQAWVSFESSLDAFDEARYQSNRWRTSLRLRSIPNYWDASVQYQTQAANLTLAAIQLLEQNYVTDDELRHAADLLMVANHVKKAAEDFAFRGAQAMGETKKNYGLITAGIAVQESEKAIELLVIVIDPGML